MSIPDYQSLMLPVLEASSKGEVRIGEVVEELAQKLGLSPEDRSELLPSGRQTVFSNRVHWAKSYLSKAHLVEITRRGYFRITPRGQKVIEGRPSQIDNRLLMQFEEFRQFRERSSEADEPNSQTVRADQKQTPDELMRTAHRQIETALGQELLDASRSWVSFRCSRQVRSAGSPLSRRAVTSSGRSPGGEIAAKATSRKAREVAHPQLFRSMLEDKPALYSPIKWHPPFMSHLAKHGFKE